MISEKYWRWRQAEVEGRGGGVKGEIEPNYQVCLAENQSSQNGCDVGVRIIFVFG